MIRFPTYALPIASQLYINLLVPAGNQSNFIINGTPLVGTFAAVPGTSGAWVEASISLPLATYPQGSVISVINTTSKFHLSTIDINGGGTSYAYFSDYGSINATASALPNPVCVGSNIQLSANTQPGATYSWAGPASFTSSLQNPLITGSTFSNAGLYTLTINQGSCQATASVNVSVVKCPLECIIEAGYTLNFNNPYNLNFYANGNPTGGSYVWGFGDGTSPVSTAAGAIAHTYPGPGSYVVTITYITPQGQKCQKVENICIARNDVAQSKEATEMTNGAAGADFIGELYPNPTNASINIPVKQWNKNTDAKASITIYTIEGKKVSGNVVAIPESGMINFSVKELPVGSYLCEITSDQGKVIRKFVKL